MAFEIELPNGELVRTDELLHGKVVDIAKRNKVSWSHVVDFPIGGDGSLMVDLYKTFCREHGVKMPVTMTMATLAGKFRQVDPPTPDEDDDAVDDGIGNDEEDLEDEDPSTVDAPAST